MPNISLTVPETEQSVIRPVILDIVKQIKDITKIPAETMILYPGEIEKTYQPGSAIDNPTEDRSRFLNTNMVHIEVDEDYNKDTLLSTAVTRPEHLHIFFDDKLKVVVRPVYSNTTISINFKFRSKSQTAIKRWRDDIRIRISMMRDVNLHQVSYHYLIPADITRVLKEIHRLRETVEPYNESFATYLTTNGTTRLTELSNQSGEKTGLAIAETQMRIVGYFDFDSTPDKPEQDSESETFIGSFTYKFSFDKPIACNMSYPVMVHNQILSTEFRPPEESYNLDNQIGTYSYSYDALSFFEITNKIDRITGKSPGITLPPFDEFTPTSILPYTATIFTALCQVTEEDKRTLLNLRELDFVILDGDVLNFVDKSEYPFLLEAYKSLLHVDVYIGNNITSNGTFSVDKNLNVISNQDLDFRLSYRVRFSIVTNIDMLTDAAIDRIRRYPVAMVKILQSINEALRNNFEFNNLANSTVIPKRSLDTFISKGFSKTGSATYTASNNLPFTIFNNGNSGKNASYPNGVGGVDLTSTSDFLKWWPKLSSQLLYGIVNKTNNEISTRIGLNTVQLSSIVTIKNQQ